MAVVKMINSRKGSKQTKYDLYRIVQYIKKQESEGGLITGINCTAGNAYNDMLLNKRIFNKEKGRMYVHMVQSFPKDLDLNPEMIHEIGIKLIKELSMFDNFQVLMATHTDEDHVHNHFCINSVGLDGKKWQLSKGDLDKIIKKKSLELCEEYQIPIQWKDEGSKEKLGNDDVLHTAKRGEYEKQKQGKSWKYELFLAVKECTKHSHSKDEFIENMKQLGYSTQWDDQHKYITFTTPAGKKCRNNKLYPTERFTKEYLLGQFEKNAERRSEQAVNDHQRQMNKLANMVDKLLTAHRRNRSGSNLDDFLPLNYLHKNLEGQALKEKAIEKANAGYDWENDWNYER